MNIAVPCYTEKTGSLHRCFVGKCFIRGVCTVSLEATVACENATVTIHSDLEHGSMEFRAVSGTLVLAF